MSDTTNFFCEEEFGFKSSISHLVLKRIPFEINEGDGFILLAIHTHISFNLYT